MPNSAPLQSTFIGGEFSPLMYGRADASRYKQGMKTCLNYVLTLQGPLLPRPGTKFVAETETMTEASRLVEFEFSITQAYILEFGDAYIRFYRDHGQITSGGNPHEIVSPYAEADLFELKFTQSADVLYIVHPDYAPRKLSRTGHTSWTLTEIDFQDGPYLAKNTTATTLTPSATTGSITLTASATTGINDDTGFQSTDVGRLVRFQDDGPLWTWLEITGVTSTTVVDADIKGPDLTNANASSNWRLGLWSDTTSYPAAVTFHEDRLSFAGTPDFPQRVDMSESGGYEFFAITEADGTVTDASAISFTLSANQVNVIRWLTSNEKGLLIGTTRAEWLIRPSSRGEALTPTNVNAKPSTRWGSRDIQPVQAGEATLFVQRAGRKVREAVFFEGRDSYRAPDLTFLAEHITEGGLTEIAWQTVPHPVLWAVRTDGTLLAMAYERDVDSLFAGWSRSIIGGVSDANGTQAKVESVAVIPTPDGTSEEVWVIVQRRIDGATKRYVEFLMPYFTDDVAQEDAFFVDSGLTYDGAPATNISGLDHLEGETVSVLADGAVVPDKTVASGAITLDDAAEVVHVGYGYNADGQMLRLESGSATGTSIGKTRRTHRLGFMLHRILGFQYGFSFDDLEDIIFRSTSDPLGEATPLFSGIKSQEAGADYDFDNFVTWRQSQPIKGGAIQAVMPQMKTEDRQ